MAVGIVLPLSTCDIHLLRTGGGNTFQMVVGAVDAATSVFNNVSDSTDTSFVGFDASLVTVTRVGAPSPHLLFTTAGVGAGETIGKITHRDTSVVPNVTFEFLVRVRVHASLSSFWIGNNQITIHQGTSNYVLSVYASFADGTRGDITGHPYVRLASNSAAATVDNVGRLTGVSVGTAPIEVRVGATVQTIDVRVVPPVTTDRPIVRRIHGSGSFSERHNILFLGEGFSNVADFDRVASEIKARLMFSVSHSPYNALRDSFNIWTACEPQDHPSPEGGITFALDVKAPTPATPAHVPVGTPVPPGSEFPVKPAAGNYSLFELVGIVGVPTPLTPPPANLAQARNTWAALRDFDGVTLSFDGAKLEQTIFDAWLELSDPGPLQAKNSKLGICHASRLGERRGKTIPIPRKNNWYLPDAEPRSLAVDKRRQELGSFRGFFNAYLSSLKLAGVGITDPNHDIGVLWAAGGPAEGLACLIVNDGYLGGTRLLSVGATGAFNAFASSINVHTHLAVTQTGTVLNHAPNTGTVPHEVITTVLSHELAHALNLLDEYEGYEDPVGHASVTNATPFQIQEIRDSRNLTVFQDIESRTTPGKIDPSRVKWNLDRIRLASRLVGPATNSGANSVRVQLRAGDGIRWRQAMTQNQQVFLRHPDLTRDPTTATGRPLGPLTIDAASNLAGDTLVLRGGQVIANAFPAGSILYQPRLDRSGNIQKLIHPSVLADLVTRGLATPPKAYGSPSACINAVQGPENPPASITNFRLPAVASEVVGLFEGGGTFTCRVYRACGSCRMRDFDPLARQQIRFCFVCKYMLVNLIDPSVHHVIDALYP